MNLDSVIENRRSIRIFTEKIVSDSVIREIIKSANFAPSACNKQAWKFIIIKDKENLKLLSDLGGAYFIQKAPQAILVLYSNVIDNVEYSDHIQSASAAIQNIQLKISSLKLGSCCIDNLPSKKTVKKIFSIPRTYDPIALIVFGYPGYKPVVIKRKYSLDQIISYEKFNFESSDLLADSYKIHIRKYLRKIYINLPNYFKKMLVPAVRLFEKRDFS